MKKSAPWNVLVLPAAAPAGLEIARALGVGKEVIVYGAERGGFEMAGFYFRNLRAMPDWNDAACLPWLQRCCDELALDALFPADLKAALWLAERAAQIPAHVMTSGAAACANPQATQEALAGVVPMAPPQRQGKTYTVDCFSAADGAVLYAGARVTGADGITQAAELPMARDWAERIGAKLGLNGAWHFRAQAGDDGALALLEVMPLLAGDSAAGLAQGPNFPLLSLYAAAGYALQVDTFSAAMPMALCVTPRFRYDRPVAAVYMDLDETLILRGAVNPQLAALIFQCRNRNIPVHLITRHPGDLAQTLARYRLASLFERIIHITDRAKPKAHFIDEVDAVLIDDSFQERQQATRLRNIRCFDAAGAVCLLDERL